jgi:hypothetical protein
LNIFPRGVTNNNILPKIEDLPVSTYPCKENVECITIRAKDQNKFENDKF